MSVSRRSRTSPYKTQRLQSEERSNPNPHLLTLSQAKNRGPSMLEPAQKCGWLVTTLDPSLRSHLRQDFRQLRCHKSDTHERSPSDSPAAAAPAKIRSMVCVVRPPKAPKWPPTDLALLRSRRLGGVPWIQAAAPTNHWLDSFIQKSAHNRAVQPLATKASEDSFACVNDGVVDWSRVVLAVQALVGRLVPSDGDFYADVTGLTADRNAHTQAHAPKHTPSYPGVQPCEPFTSDEACERFYRAEVGDLLLRWLAAEPPANLSPPKLLQAKLATPSEKTSVEVGTLAGSVESFAVVPRRSSRPFADRSEVETGVGGCIPSLTAKAWEDGEKEASTSSGTRLESTRASICGTLSMSEFESWQSRPGGNASWPPPNDPAWLAQQAPLIVGANSTENVTEGKHVPQWRDENDRYVDDRCVAQVGPERMAEMGELETREYSFVAVTPGDSPAESPTESHTESHTGTDGDSSRCSRDSASSSGCECWRCQSWRRQMVAMRASPLFIRCRQRADEAHDWQPVRRRLTLNFQSLPSTHFNRMRGYKGTYSAQ